MVVKLLPLVKRMAQQMRGRLPLHIELDDLVSTGMLGLVDAVRRFDTRKHVKLESYARHRIRGAILDGLRSVDHASRDMRRKNKTAEKAYYNLEAKLGRPPDDEEMAEALGISLKKWYRALWELGAVGVDWLRPMGAVGMKEIKEPDEKKLAADNSDNQLEQCYRREQRDILNCALAELSERERRVVLLYYAQGLSMKQIGAKLGIDESRVSQLHAAALARLRARATRILRYPQPGAPRPWW